MTAPRVTQRRVVLDRLNDDRQSDESALFAAPPGGFEDMSLMVPAADYRALGEPERITVTIDPGVLLAEPEGVERVVPLRHTMQPCSMTPVFPDGAVPMPDREAVAQTMYDTLRAAVDLSWGRLDPIDRAQWELAADAVIALLRDMTCSNCHTDARHSDRTGCCDACGRLFKGLGAFDRHWTTPAPGERACVDPLTVQTGDGEPVYETTEVPGGIAFRFRTDDIHWEKP